MDGMCNRPSRWGYWFTNEHHRMRYVQALSLMKSMSHNSSIMAECYNRLINYTGARMRVVGGHATDMFYIPATLLVKWVTVAKVIMQ